MDQLWFALFLQEQPFPANAVRSMAVVISAPTGPEAEQIAVTTAAKFPGMQLQHMYVVSG